MAQLSVTPWKYIYELADLRKCFYPNSTTGGLDRRREGCDRVSTWTTRGNVPHTIEATALLINAILHDEQNPFGTSNIATYSTAFARFVTGLTDVGQNKKRKLSMYDLGKGIGLPAAFIDLRHQIIHDALPSLIVLRQTTQRAVQWLYQHYWRDIELEAPMTIDPTTGTGRKKTDATYEAELEKDPHQYRFRPSRVDGNFTSQPNSVSEEVAGKEKEVGSVITTFRLPDRIVFVPGALKSVLQPLNRPRLVTLAASLTIARAMHIQSIPMWTGSSNNYAYLVTDDKSNDAVIIDPANPPEVAPVLKEQVDSGKINLTAIMNTHHHWDHAGGNSKMLDQFKGLSVIGGKDCEAVTKTPKHGETFKIGQGISVKALHTPCHTQDSICWFMEDGDERVVFTGDTLFIGGCGKFFEGKPEEMHTALNKVLAALPDDTKVYPGHEYTKSNVKFLTTVLQNEAVKKLQSFAENNKETQGKFTIGDEKQHNVFMRVDDPTIQKATGKTDPVDVMGKLREMKNSM
ncbi:Cytoplasmic glyoxalase II [Trapelia coarctata]|nr:Cytoplasmic glyoxalase II [Trapelia coarctata]